MLKVIEKITNRILAMDPDAKNAVAGLAGKKLAVELTSHNLVITVIPATNGISLVTDSNEDPDVIIKGTPVNLIGFLATSGPNGEGFNGKLEITGDVNLAQRFQAIGKNLDLDLEEHLSHWTGDLFARKLGNLARTTRRFASESGATLAQDISEYLRYERDFLPDQFEVDTYVDEVDRLRDDTERLKLRIDRLHAADEIT